MFQKQAVPDPFQDIQVAYILIQPIAGLAYGIQDSGRQADKGFPDIGVGINLLLEILKEFFQATFHRRYIPLIDAGNDLPLKFRGIAEFLCLNPVYHLLCENRRFPHGKVPVGHIQEPLPLCLYLIRPLKAGSGKNQIRVNLFPAPPYCRVQPLIHPLLISMEQDIIFLVPRLPAHAGFNSRQRLSQFCHNPLPVGLYHPVLSPYEEKEVHVPGFEPFLPFRLEFGP